MTTDETKRKLVAVVHADVKGYSRMMGEDDEYTVRTLASNRQEMYRLVEIHAGEVRDTAGDGFLVEFPSVVEAVKFAVEFQREMKKRNADLPDPEKMEFRIGVNIGDVIQDGGTIHGDGVNIAARLEGLADPGGICISGAAYEQVKKRLDVGFEYVGDKSVKNIAEPVPTYKVLIEHGKPAELKEKAKKDKRGKWRKTNLVAALIIVVLVASVASWYFHFHSASPPDKGTLAEAPALKLPDMPSIAVLPFVNMSGDPKQEYFSDGITEEIITALAKIQRMFVIARDSTFTYKGKHVHVQTVARELGVRYVLYGSIRKSGEQVRITSQLVDAATGNHLWSERYDRHLKDIFAVQDDIAMQIVTALRIKLTEGEQARVFGKSTGNLEAYLKVLQGREHFHRMNRQGNVRAREFAREAIELDPKFAEAYVILGMTHMMDVWWQFTESPKESMKLAVEAAEKAIALDDAHPTAYVGLCMLRIMQRQHDKAIAAGERALALSPGSAQAHHSSGTALSFGGRPEEAVAAFKKAISLNPFPPGHYFRSLGTAYRMEGQYEKAIVEYKKSLQQSPDDLFSHSFLAIAYIALGLDEEARTEAAEVLRIHPGFSLEHLSKVLPYKNQSDVDYAIASLRKAGLK
jgi:adenylate cyclase